MKNNENAIEVNNIEKSFKVYYDRGNQLKDAVIFHTFNKYKRREILKGISFEVKKGETLALIGANGCGKSTTLKLLTKILTPNAGTIEMSGRVASLIELGAGFHPDMSGKENIYINASIFGIKSKEVDERIDEIIRFSELEDFIDNPVRTYSSGMYARLAFSVAISVNADILLIDEILSVGDAAFQTKCFNRMKKLKEEGVTIVMVSHSLGQVEQICDRAIWIDDGKIREEGLPRVICRHYLNETEEKRIIRSKEEIRLEQETRLEKEIRLEQETRLEQEEVIKVPKRNCFDVAEQCGPDSERMGEGKIKFTSIKLVNENDELKNEFHVRDKIKVIMNYKSEEENIKGNFSISITRNDWIYCYESFAIRRRKDYPLLKSEGQVCITIDNLNLVEGRYILSAKCIGAESEMSDFLAQVIPFTVLEQEISEIGITSMPHVWEIN